MADEYYGIYRPRGQRKTEVDELMKIPVPDTRRNTPSWSDAEIQPGFIYEADLLYLPHDEEYEPGEDYHFALVVTDVANGRCDAAPMKDRKARDIAGGLEAIFSRDILPLPQYALKVDGGSEFKGVARRFLESRGVKIRYGRPNRHRQQAHAESLNKTIARAIFYKQHVDELRTGEIQSKWVEDLPKIIKIINDHRAGVYRKKLEERQTNRSEKLRGRCEGPSCRLLDEGTRVRVIAESPKDTQDDKLPGRFRATDLRWSREIHTITEVILIPNQPPLYQVSDINNVRYTRNQLQPV